MPHHSLCGVLKSDGRDCDIPVEPGTPFNVCPQHLRAVAEYARDIHATGRRVRLDSRCPVCGVKALVAQVGHRIATCQSCGHEVAASAPAPAPLHRVHQQPMPTSVVYYIRFGDRIKIGTTVDLDKRLLALPHDELLLTEPGSYELEKQRHRQFNRHLIAGREWFEAAPELLQFIAERRVALAS